MVAKTHRPIPDVSARWRQDGAVNVRGRQDGSWGHKEASPVSASPTPSDLEFFRRNRKVAHHHHSSGSEPRRASGVTFPSATKRPSVNARWIPDIREPPPRQVPRTPHIHSPCIRSATRCRHRTVPAHPSITPDPSEAARCPPGHEAPSSKTPLSRPSGTEGGHIAAYRPVGTPGRATRNAPSLPHAMSDPGRPSSPGRGVPSGIPAGHRRLAGPTPPAGAPG